MTDDERAEISVVEVQRPPADPARPAPARLPQGRYINRELSWLAFNARVLEEARNRRHPLLERLRFLSISANNLDEFQMVRVAGLKAQVDANVASPSIDDRSPLQQLLEIKRHSIALIADQYAIWRELRSLLREAGIGVVEEEEMTAADRAWLARWFDMEVLPVLNAASSRPTPGPDSPSRGAAFA